MKDSILNSIGQNIMTYTNKKHYETMGRTRLINRLVVTDYTNKDMGKIELVTLYRRVLDHLINTEWVSQVKVGRTNTITAIGPAAYDSRQTPEQAVLSMQEEQQEVRKTQHHHCMVKACKISKAEMRAMKDAKLDAKKGTTKSETTKMETTPHLNHQPQIATRPLHHEKVMYRRCFEACTKSTEASGVWTAFNPKGNNPAPCTPDTVEAINAGLTTTLRKISGAERGLIKACDDVLDYGVGKSTMGRNYLDSALCGSVTHHRHDPYNLPEWMNQ